MRNIKSLFALLMTAALVSLNSCDYVNGDINIDPNNPSDASMKLLLPPTQSAYGFVAGGDFGRFSSIWMQQHAGVERQHAGYEIYQVKENDVNTGWGTLYSDCLTELSIIMQKAEELGAPHYGGVAKVMTAATMGMLVDLFDAVPYREALQGADNLTPAYDPGDQVYADIQALLDEAIADLGQATSNFSPGNDDMIFKGNRTRWIAAARTLKARYYNHLGQHSNALSAIDAGALASNADNGMIPYEQGNGNPWFLFEESRGDVVMGGFLMDLMNGLSDPRRAFYATTNDAGEYAGAAAGVPNNGPTVSRFGSYYASEASPVPFVTFAEAKFIEAEAALGAGNNARAAQAYNDAVAASLASYGITDADYLASNAAETAGSITLEKIMTQKYIAMYTQPEVFTDWRRTGFPALQPAAGQTQIARRFPYPGDERRFNPNMPEGKTVFDRVFWDN